MPLVQAQIVARTFAEATHAAELMGFERRDWWFVESLNALRGNFRGMIVFYGEWFQREDAVALVELASGYAMDIWEVDDPWRLDQCEAAL